MKAILLHLKRMDWILVAATVLLAVFGLVAIYSASLRDGNLINFQKQIIFFIVGFALMIIFSFFDWRSFRDAPYLILILYVICLLGLIFLFVFAPYVRGTKSWYKIGQFSLDPVEFTKVVLIILLAKYFSKRHVELYRLRHIFLSGLYIAAPAALVFFQPNFGSALILIIIWLGILILSGIKIRHFLLLLLIFAILFAVGWGTVLKDYQRARIVSFLMPQTVNQLKIGWNQAQSKIAIGSGGIFGQGIGKGSQTQYGFLPEAHTDFIFATISEETGLMGVTILFALFIVLIWRIMKIAFSAQGNFPRLFASGLAIMIAGQIFIHIGMNVGILPIIGIPLPLISYGGSGIIAVFLAFGILQSIKASQ